MSVVLWDFALVNAASAPELVVIADHVEHGGSWYVTELDQDTQEADGFWAGLDATSTLDVAAQFFPGIAVEPDETFAAQDNNDGFQQETEDPWWSHVYGFPDYAPESIAPPEVPLAELIAAQPTFSEHDFATLVAEETTDYQSYVSELETPTEWFPPPTDAEAQAAQPSFDPQDPYAFIPVETQDYASPSVLDVSFLDATPPVETFAAQPHFGDIGIDAEETADYSNDSTLDVSGFLGITVAVEPDETFAAQPHFGDDFSTYVPIEVEDYSTLPEQNEWTAPPEVPSTELIAAQPTFSDDFSTYIAEETQDYANDSTLDVSYVAPPEVPLPELLAAQPLPEGPWIVAEETQDYANDSTLDVSALTPATAQEPDTTFAAQPHYGDIQIDAEETQDYQPESTLGVEAAYLTATAPDEVFASYTTFENLIEHFEPAGLTIEADGFASLDVSFLDATPPVEVFAAQPHYGEAFWPETETEDYANDSTLDVGAFQAIDAPAPTEVLLAAQPHYGEAFWPAEETEDYVPFSSGDTSFLAPPPIVALEYDSQGYNPEIDSDGRARDS
jgi:hypothetical protein